MPFDVNEPNTIRLVSHQYPQIKNDVPAGGTIKPGMLIEMYLDGSTLKWRANSSATNICPRVVALENTMHNKGIDDTYAAGDRVLAWWVETGDVFYGLINSAENIVDGDLLQPNGDGTLKEATSAAANANVAWLQSIKDSPGAVTASTRVKVQRIV